VKITPLDIRKQEFRRSLRGVDPEEVRVFLSLVADEYERLLHEAARLRDDSAELRSRIDEFQKIEKTLQNTLVTAERVTADSRDNARREAELIVREAESRAERILEDARRRLSRMNDDILELRDRKEAYLQRFRSLVQMQTDLLDAHGEDLAEVDGLSEVASDAVRRAGVRSRARAADGEDAPEEEDERPMPRREGFVEVSAGDDEIPPPPAR
jgi:cell division initiation protein